VAARNSLEVTSREITHVCERSGLVELSKLTEGELRVTNFPRTQTLLEGVREFCAKDLQIVDGTQDHEPRG
jgi:hypothetical protein